MSKYLVVEGNRRICAAKLIMEDQEIYSITHPDIIDEIKELEVLVIENSTQNEISLLTDKIQGLRHISGPKEWGAYQKSKMVARMKDNGGKSFSDIGEMFAMSATAIGRYYRTNKVIEAIQEDDEYKEFFWTKSFSLFEEVIKKPELRDYFGWNDTDNKFTNIEACHKLYRLILCRENDEDIIIDEEDKATYGLNNPTQVRALARLKSQNIEFFEKVLNDTISIDAAIAINDEKEEQKDVKRLMEEFLESITDLHISNIKSFNTELAEKIKEILDKNIEMHNVLKGTENVK